MDGFWLVVPREKNPSLRALFLPADPSCAFQIQTRNGTDFAENSAVKQGEDQARTVTRLMGPHPSLGDAWRWPWARGGCDDDGGAEDDDADSCASAPMHQCKLQRLPLGLVDIIYDDPGGLRVSPEEMARLLR
ncbi:phage integrase site specific recombinase [Anopheles sinensis]|uniref:Phage integrase site specific recombinase n=1 Tax=Anopheles sinensis TaxID=74873 RepID=A0A084WCG1_ANOSI|nr:phage integrase site specific recombinase [Anopheles sinensis]